MRFQKWIKTARVAESEAGPQASLPLLGVLLPHQQSLHPGIDLLPIFALEPNFSASSKTLQDHLVLEESA
jgi:hypothetical protein